MVGGDVTPTKRTIKSQYSTLKVINIAEKWYWKDGKNHRH